MGASLRATRYMQAQVRWQVRGKAKGIGNHVTRCAGATACADARPYPQARVGRIGYQTRLGWWRGTVFHDKRTPWGNAHVTVAVVRAPQGHVIQHIRMDRSGWQDRTHGVAGQDACQRGWFVASLRCGPCGVQHAKGCKGRIGLCGVVQWAGRCIQCC